MNNILKDEGFRIEPYFCTEGKATWLCGRNVEDRPLTSSEWRILAQLGIVQGGLYLVEKDIESIQSFFKARIEWDELPEPVQEVLINMAYNMGTDKFNERLWPRFFNAVRRHNWADAAAEMIDSKWFRQVGLRGIRLHKKMTSMLK